MQIKLKDTGCFLQTLAESWREHFPNSFYDASFALIPKSGKGNYKGEKLQSNIFHKYRCKNP